MIAFLADECFSGKIVEAMRTAGYRVERAGVLCPSAPDMDVLALAYSRNEVLLTEDYDFGELCVRFGLPAHGVIVVAVKKLPATAQGAWVVQCLNKLGEKVLRSFVTIEPGRLRRRPL